MSDLKFFAYMKMGDIVMPSQKGIYKGTKLRVSGTQQFVTIISVSADRRSAVYKGENVAGTIVKLVDGLWHSNGQFPLVFDILDTVEFS